MCCGRHDDETSSPAPAHSNGSPHVAGSVRWFGYIAVGIVLVSMTVGLLWMAWFVYTLIRPRLG